MPSDRSGEIIRVLKDGYWDLTAVVRMSDESLRVRKQSKPLNPDQIWGLESLRREIAYLQNQSSDAARVFPPVLNSWDQPKRDGSPDVGYDLPFYTGHSDAGSLARENALEQSEIDIFQNQLADALLQKVHHHRVTDAAPLSPHLNEVATDTFVGLLKDTSLKTLIEADQITLNGKPALGPQNAWKRISNHPDCLTSLDAVSPRQIHGDFFLENLLWAKGSPPSDVSQLVLIDPVSVAGISAGPPVFDLVKYESYAKGELLALRSEWVHVVGFDREVSKPEFEYSITWDHSGLIPFRDKNWHHLFHERFVAHHGTINRMHYHLIDGYFSLAMALNTDGIQRRARLLKATEEFNAVLAHLI